MAAAAPSRSLAVGSRPPACSCSVSHCSTARGGGRRCPDTVASALTMRLKICGRRSGPRGRAAGHGTEKEGEAGEVGSQRRLSRCKGR